MATGDKYVMNGVWLTCDKGAAPSRFNVTPKPVQLYDEHFANELDKIPQVNIMPFGVCSVTQKPCLPVPVLWERVMEEGLTVMGARPLLDTSKCQCSVGGKMSINFTRADANAAVALDQKLDQVDAVADEAQEAAGWMFWGGLACAVGGAILVATGVGAPLGAALITGGSMAMKASTVLSAAATITKAATGFARDPSRENGLSIVGQAVQDLVVDYIMNKVGGAVVKRLGAAAQRAMNRLGISERAARLANRILCKTTGHPVDVISGYLYTETVDFEFPGPIPLRWERLWNSTSIHAGPLGQGWHHSYDLALFVDAAQDLVGVRAADGRGLAFRALPVGGREFSRLEKMTLLRDERGYGLLDHAQGLTYRFGPDRGDGVRPLAAVENANGFAITFAYDERGFLAAIRDSAGRQFQVSCDGQGRILTIRTAHPTEPRQWVTLVTYAYNRRGELVQARDALGQAAAYQYAEGLLVQETFKNGLRFYFAYAGQGPEARCVHTWGDEGIYDHTLVYDLEAKRTVVTNSLGYATTYQGNENGLVVEQWDARGGVTLTEYNEYNEVFSETDALGHTTSNEYDERGNHTQARNGDTMTKRLFDVSDKLLRLTDVMGNQWQWQYDAHGNVVEQVGPTGSRTHYTYQHGLLHTMTDPTGTAYLRYNATLDTEEVQLTNGQISRALYDGWGRIRKLTDARGNVQWRTYDLLDRVVEVNESDGTIRTFTYDQLNNIVRAKDRYSDVQYAYRGTGSMIRRVEAGTATEFLYDTEEQLRGIVNEHGLLYRFTLDAEGDVETESGFDGLTRHYVRDVGGRVSQLVRADGRRTSYKYTAAGQVAQVCYSDGTSEDFRFAPDGTMLEARNATATVTYSRDSLGRILTESQGAFSVASEYDNLGNRTSIRSSLGADIQYQYTKAGAVAHIQAGTWQAFFERDAQGLEVQRTLSGGTNTQWRRDALGRPIEQRVSSGVRRQVRQRHYQWVADDRLTQIQDTVGGTTQFNHDALGNLAATVYNDGTQQFRLPDAVGNLFRTSSRQEQLYGPAGQLLKDNGTLYTYDSDGNLTQKTTSSGKEWQYRWNEAGRLEHVLRPDGHIVNFTYDALGRRLSKQYQGLVTRWVWDGDILLHEWSQENASLVKTSKVATWLFDETGFAPLAKLQPDEQYSFVSDHLGTPLEMHSQMGIPVWAAELDSYGLVRQYVGEAIACPFRYQGQYEDVETGLYYNRFRYYDPSTGQYISQDPIRLDGGLNLYEYVTDTASLIDPLGLAVPFELGTYGSLNGSTHVGDNLQAHELLRHEYLVQQNLATKANRLSGNPSIALDNAHHTRVGGAHWHEAQLRAQQGLGRNDFHPSFKRELDITQGGLRKAGVKASTARRLRKQSEKFYRGLLKKAGCP